MTITTRHHLWALLAAGLMLVLPGLALAAKTPTIMYEGDVLRNLQPPPQIYRDEVVMEVRNIARLVKADAEFRGSWVRLLGRDTTVEFTTGDPNYQRNGQWERFPVAPIERDGYVFAPLGQLVQDFGGDFTYDERDRTAYVDFGTGSGPASNNGLWIIEPRDDALVNTATLEVRGRSYPGSEIRVLVQDGALSFFDQLTGQEPEKLADKVVKTDRSGNWGLRVDTRWGEGTYDIIAQRVDRSFHTSAEVRVSFKLAPRAADPEDLVIVTPEDGARVGGDYVEIAGRATPRYDLRLTVRDNRDRELFSERREVAGDGRWSARVRLSGAEAYRVLAELLDRNDRVVAHRSVQFGWALRADFAITRPADRTAVYHTPFEIQGVAAPGTRVAVIVCEPGGRCVSNKTTRADSRGLWLVPVVLLQRGQYEIQARTLDGAAAGDRARIDFQPGGDQGNRQPPGGGRGGRYRDRD